MAAKFNTSSVGLVITGVFGSGLYFIMEAVDPRGISLSAWMNLGIILAVSILAQVLINRAEGAKKELASINQTLEEKVRERTTELEEANKLLNEEVAIRTLTEEFLRESEDKYRTIFENTGTATIIINEDKTIALANNEFQNLSGYSVDEVTGSRYWTDFFTKEAVRTMLDFHRTSLSDPNATLKNLECVFLGRENNEKSVMVTVARITGTDQSLASISDISDLRQAQKQIQDHEEQAKVQPATSPEESPEPSAGVEGALRHALARQGIVTYYQPIIRCATKKIVGFEALARWKHPHEGVITPDMFLAKAESTGILVDMDRMMLKQACGQAKKWQDMARTTEPLTISVNVSKGLLLQPGFDQEVMNILVEAGLAPNSLVLELAMDAFLGDTDAAKAAIEKLAAVGVRINLDNCTDAISDASAIKVLPVDAVKIGRELIGKLGDQEDENKERVMSIIGSVLSMEKQVVAVGVESVGQHVLLSGLKCQLSQGFLYGKPMERQVIDRVIQGRKKGAK